MQDLPVFFLSYDEGNADAHWEKVRSLAPQATRVHGVKGVFDAHLRCANQAKDEYFFVVDGDNDVFDEFRFRFSPDRSRKVTYVWRAKNAVNGLEYGFGGIKLLHRDALLQTTAPTTDFTTSWHHDAYEIVPVLASTTRFNSSPFHAWRSAFRECVKLASATIRNENSKETSERLSTWLRSQDINAAHWRWVKLGASMGLAFAEENRGDFDSLKNINDFTWLRMTFMSDVIRSIELV